MKKIITLIIALVAIFTKANADNQFAWYGSKGKAKVETGLASEGAIDPGKWFVFNDDGECGESKIVWDNGSEDEKIDDNLVQQYGGLSGTAVLVEGDYMIINPYISVGFNVAGLVETESPGFYDMLPADATAWGGIAIAYSCDINAHLQLGFEDYVNSSIGYVYPEFELPAAPDGNFVRIPWSDFKQPRWYNGITKISGPEAAKQLASIRFLVQKKQGSYHFKISAIGAYDMPENGGQGGDTRTKITSVQGTSSDMMTIPVLDGAVTKPTISVSSGEPAYFDVSNGCWQKKVSGSWQDVQSGTFGEGTWRFRCQVRIDSSTDPDNQYVLANNVTVKVNGTAWGKGAFDSGNAYSCIEVYSPIVELGDIEPFDGKFAWYGSKGKAKVETGLASEGAIDPGKWFVFNDDGECGESKIVWDNGSEDEKIDDNLVQQYGGLSGTAVLVEGDYMIINPYISVGFNVAGLVETESPGFYDMLPADATAWGGIAIAYSCDINAHLQLGFEDYVNSSIGYVYPEFELPAAPDGNFVRIPWSDFKQPRWYNGITKISGPEAAKQLASIRFLVQKKQGSYHFKISAIGAYDMPESDGLGGDTRTKIASVQGTSSDMLTIPVLGGAVTKPTISVTSGEPAYFDASNGCWQKKVSGSWQDVPSGTFGEGTWRFKCQVRIDSSTDPGNQYVLDDNVTVKVNGTAWGKETVRVYNDNSSVNVYSPEITVDSSKREINMVDATSPDLTVIPEIDAPVTKPTITVMTGEPAYFLVNSANGWWQKKVNGKWETVRSGNFDEGTWRFYCQVRIDSSTDPKNQFVLAKNVTVKVNGKEWEKETVYVYDTYSLVFVTSPEITVDSHKKIHLIEAVSFDMVFVPMVDDSVKEPEITVISGEPAYFDTSNGCWQKKVGSEWLDVQEGTFYEGTWRFKCQVRIDSSTDPGNQYALGEDVRIIVEETEWEKEGDVHVDVDYSYVYVISPEMKIKQPVLKCATPTISYSKGVLTFNCETEGAECQSFITDSDISPYTGNKVMLSVTYYITVYATKDGYENSDEATASLCWIDVEPRTEGLQEDAVTEVKAMPVLIQTQGGNVTIQGASEGTPIAIYDTSGKQYGSALSEKDRTTISTSLQPGTIAIVKIGEKAIKIVVK